MSDVPQSPALYCNILKSNKGRIFADVSQNIINEFKETKPCKNTEYNTNTAAHVLVAFIANENKQEILKVTNIQQLDELLSKFWPSVRNKDGQQLQKSTLICYRNGINRYLKSLAIYNEIDIIHDADFESSNKVFFGYLKNLKEIGNGCTNHFSPIEDDLVKIKRLSCNNPRELQLKVWFFLQYFFCRRGRENMDSKLKTDITILKNSCGREYIIQQKDEGNKNHTYKDNDATIGGRIYATTDNDCPVKAFKIYLEKLHSECIYLWQKPSTTAEISSKTWFCKSKIGHNMIATFMPQISNICGLSKKYTNHCIRVTTCSILSNCGYNDSEIQSISGHKSVSSLSLYRRPNETRKREMSDQLLTAANGSSEKSDDTSVDGVEDSANNLQKYNLNKTFKQFMTGDKGVEDVKNVKKAKLLNNFHFQLDTDTLINTEQRNPSFIFNNCTFNNVQF